MIGFDKPIHYRPALPSSLQIQDDTAGTTAFHHRMALYKTMFAFNMHHMVHERSIHLRLKLQD